MMEPASTIVFELGWDYKKVRSPGYVDVMARAGDIFVKRSFQAVGYATAEQNILKKWDVGVEGTFEKKTWYESTNGVEPFEFFSDLMSVEAGVFEAIILALDLAKKFEPVEAMFASYLDPLTKGKRNNRWRSKRHHRALKNLCEVSSVLTIPQNSLTSGLANE